ncbi:sensor histidine kinase [Pseudacidovorax sp. NFM-22]|uniref:sensor histidine kinase n=1 Tax=Pseudacidovorax sp. NFM-22 TaxID=2744469 RepID=UPI00210305AF|nr:sensor histidine kinase [Pseudacidovorax sp. NFM-22]
MCSSRTEPPAAARPGLRPRVARWLQRSSLWQRLALLLLPGLAAVTALELWMTRHDALESANSAYDRSLLGALKSIDANISTASGGLSLEMPYTMFEFFELTASGQVFFRVATSDGLVELGSADFPQPSTPPPMGVPVFYDAMYFGEPVRLAAYERELERMPAGSTARRVMIQVGESTRSREVFSARFVRSAALRDLLVLLLMLGGTTFALLAALRPLSRLAQEVEERAPDDLNRISQENLPAEIRPLVAAVNQQMARTQELVSLQRQFLDDASHQLRTHLTTLQMQVDYARREQDPGMVQDALAALEAEIASATRSAQQLLALGRSDTVPVEAAFFDSGELLREVALQWLPTARRKRIDLGIQPEEGAPVAVGDRHLLREAFANLVANAVAYTPDGGTVTLLSGSDAQGWWLAVEDNGPGLDAEDRARLGQRFQRGSGARPGGFGLGLAIARSIAQRHRGELRLLDRAPSSGLHAGIWWPRDRRADATRTTGDTHEPSHHGPLA